ncbi:MAG: organomercurial lyase [Ktedonobacterales bacterium]
MSNDTNDTGVNRHGDDMTQKMQEYLSAYEPDHLRLLLWAVRHLAHGHPLTPAQIDQRIAELDIAPDAAHQTLRELTEQDARGDIVGAMGLSLLSDHPHRFSVADVSLSAWCAGDTLFLPALLQQTATIESPSPVTHTIVRLRVSPTRVEDVSPASAVMSSVLMDPRRADLTSVEAVLSAYCRNIHFFATRAEAKQWANGREDLAILTVDEGFAEERQVSAGVLAIVGQSA